MITIRKSHQRGHNEIDWLSSFYSFSFADYHDANFMGFSCLRVINEDYIKPSKGFGKHGHQDMEILTYVIQGSLAHQDSLGTGSIIKPGEIQRMSAGSGVKHSEFNQSDQEVLHLLQIWILPDTKSLPPSYEQKTIPQQKNKLILIAAPQGGEGAVTIHQDAKLWAAYLEKNQKIAYSFAAQRCGWLQMIKGNIHLNDIALSAGDGAAIENEKNLEIVCQENAEFLFFDLPPS